MSPSSIIDKVSAAGWQVSVFRTAEALTHALAIAKAAEYKALLIWVKQPAELDDTVLICRQAFDSYGLSAILLIDAHALPRDMAKLQSLLWYNYHCHCLRHPQDSALVVPILAKMGSGANRHPGANYQHRLNDLILRDAPYAVKGMVKSEQVSDVLARWVTLHPERLLGDRSRVFMGNQRSVLSGPKRTFQLCIAFHSLSPCGEGLSFLASVGRDVSIASALGVHHIRYCLQGPARALLNSSVTRLLKAQSPELRRQVLIREIRRRRDFLSMFSGHESATREPAEEGAAFIPNIECRVVDFESGPEVDDVVPVEELVMRAWGLFQESFPDIAAGAASVSRSTLTAQLDYLERSIRDREWQTDPGEQLYLVKALKGLLAVSPTVSLSSLRYYFLEHAYLERLTHPVLRVGPVEERNWDGPLEFRKREYAQRIAGGVYTRKYLLKPSWGLPYSYVSARTASEFALRASLKDELIFVGDNDAERMSRLLESSASIESRRFTADLASFAIVAAEFIEPCEETLRLLPHPMCLKNNWILPGSPRYLRWIKEALNSATLSRRIHDCPAGLVPYLWTDDELRAALPAVGRFMAAVSLLHVNFLTGRQTGLIARLSQDRQS